MSVARDLGTRSLANALRRVTRAVLSGDPGALGAAEAELAAVLGRVRALADLRGRADLLAAARKALRRHGRSLEQLTARQGTQVQVDLPAVTFHEAVRKIVEREPVLAQPFDGEPLYQAVAREYADGAFALAKATTIKQTELVQQAITRMLEKGIHAKQAVIDAVDGATDAYAEMVVRTNVTGAYAQGRLEAASHPVLAGVIVGLRYVTVGDGVAPAGRVRENHQAVMDSGLQGPPDDPIWATYAPPLGYQCRCRLEPVTRFDVAPDQIDSATGRLRPFPPSRVRGGPDPGFIK